jgi:hypothetical protein
MWADYPVGVFRAATENVVGWTVVVILTVLGTFVCVLWIDRGEFPDPWDWTGLFTMLTLGALFSPWAFVADGVLLLAWYIPLRVESLWSKVAGLVLAVGAVLALLFVTHA